MIKFAEQQLVYVTAKMIGLPEEDTEFLLDIELINQLKFSPREKQCLRYVLQGKTSKEIAEILQLSYRTVEKYINDIKRKTNCQYNASYLLKYFQG